MFSMIQTGLISLVYYYNRPSLLKDFIACLLYTYEPDFLIALQKKL